MRAKPEKCCEMGSYECQTPMPIGGKVRMIDYCIADIVAALNAGGIETVASCCGHGDEWIAVISLADGRELRVKGHTPAGGPMRPRDAEKEERLAEVLHDFWADARHGRRFQKPGLISKHLKRILSIFGHEPAEETS